MKRTRPDGGVPARAPRLTCALLLAGAALWTGLSPVWAATRTKIDIKNPFAASKSMRVSIGSLPSLVLASNNTLVDAITGGRSTLTTKFYNKNTFGAYPYATSTNTQAKFGFLDGTVAINTNEYVTATITPSNPQAGLNISGWYWYATDTSTASLGKVPDPSARRWKGPNSAALRGNAVATIQDWVSLNVAYTNEVKYKTNGGILRPTSTVAYPDFAVGVVPFGQSRAQDLEWEQALSLLAFEKVNSRSNGSLAPPVNLLRTCKHPKGTGAWVDLHPNQSCIDERHTSNFFPIIVLAKGQAPPVPTPTQPVVVFLTATAPSIDGVDPAASMVLHPSNRAVKVLKLGPGASFSVQARVLLGAVHLERVLQTGVPANIKLLFVSRMREVSQLNTEVTEALFGCVDDYPEFGTVYPAGTFVPASSATQAQMAGARALGFSSASAGGGTRIQSAEPAPATLPEAPYGTEARDRQNWAHTLRLYNRSLRGFKRAGDEPLRAQNF